MRTLLCLLLMSMPVGCSKNSPQPPPAASGKVDGAAAPALEGAAARLPAQAGPWTRPAAVRRITADTIFDYMDGGGELYLAYRFDHLDVLEYKAADEKQGTILVELYSMQTPDDAFGLLSTDWTGEAVEIGPPPPPGLPVAASLRSPFPHNIHARYGAGLLRMASGRLYARILASRETPGARDAVLAIGKSLATERMTAPQFVFSVPADLSSRGQEWMVKVRDHRTCFFRSHLVLNSQYFLASEDILNLGTRVDAVTAEYEPPTPGTRPPRLIVIRYETQAGAAAGLDRFLRAYFPGRPTGPANSARSGNKPARPVRTEHGWVAWAEQDQSVTIALDVPSQAMAETLAGLAARIAAHGGNFMEALYPSRRLP
jgi:hypothetical protein